MTQGKRVYHSPLRAEQAQRTRTAVLDAAGRRFLDQGYAATTMKDIAAEAGVSVQTVFAQGSKSALLLACVDRAVVGDDEAAPLLQRELFVRLLTHPDRQEKLRALRAITVDRTPGVVPMLGAFASAAAVDPEIAEAWSEYGRRRYQDSRAIVEAFAPWLRPGLDVDRATEIFWALFPEATPDALLNERGWTLDEYADFLIDTFERLFLDAGA